MDKEKKQMYSARVTQANASELVVITYEIMEDCIAEARGFEAGFEQELHRARRLLNELMGSLDYRYSLSLELFNLYRYVDRELARALFEKKEESLDYAERVLSILKQGFVEVAREDTSEPLMENTQKLYAGLTYGKHSLNEVSLNENESKRGFRA